jgi:hypothetical protein
MWVITALLVVILALVWLCGPRKTLAALTVRPCAPSTQGGPLCIYFSRPYPLCMSVDQAMATEYNRAYTTDSDSDTD